MSDTRHPLAVLGGEPIYPPGPPDWPITDSEIEQVFQELIKTGDWGRYHGPHCDRLREAIRDYHDCQFAHLCASGTAAVELALRAVGVKSDDEVIMSAYDFKANFTNIVLLDAVPVLIDLRTDDWQLDADQLEAALSEKTKAIIVSHLHGGLVDMNRVRSICEPRGIAIIEDICQLEGARIQGTIAGMGGDIGVMSFGGSKLLSAGRGGALITDNDLLQQRITLHTARGNDVSPLSEMQAAVLLPQLNKLDERTRIRKSSADKLFDALQNSEGLIPLRSPYPDSSPGYYKVGFQYDPTTFGGLSRDRFSEAMIAEGFAVHPGFRSLHKIHSKKRYRTMTELTEADRADDNILVLHHPILLSEADWQSAFMRAVDKIKQFSDDLISDHQ
ncbi:MAG: aminotransferase class I/II-fold pyridoxal phosphate-dependent enzyme [Planctomycetaceae bacterium]|jgi:perosamine synthetase|nr:aminotransferase class I/II-fold pyridoxal phosphate-dependent enzyme [Planctomycetaceae bacterium]